MTTDLFPSIVSPVSYHKSFKITLEQDEAMELRILRDNLFVELNHERKRNAGSSSQQRAKFTDGERNLMHAVEVLDKILKQI